MINTNMSLHQYRPDMILLMSLVSTLVLFLLVSLVVIVTWMLRKKLGEFSYFWRTFSIILKIKVSKAVFQNNTIEYFFGSCYNRSHNTTEDITTQIVPQGIYYYKKIINILVEGK